MLPYLIAGGSLGLAAGLLPGPLLAFLVAQTVRHGQREGSKVALAPMISDAPIVAATLLLLARFSTVEPLLGGISITGGLYVVWLGIESLRVRRLAVAGNGPAARSICKAISINLLNPHVYLFWGTVGSPTVLRASTVSLTAAAGFIFCFYLLLCGSKLVVAVLVHHSREFLTGRGYLWTVRILGGVLAGFGVWLIRGGVLSFIH